MNDGDTQRMKTVVKEKDIAIFRLPKSRYSENIRELAKTICRDGKRMCYVAIGKHAKNMGKLLSNNGIDAENVWSVGCTMENASEKDQSKPAMTIKTPSDLTELGIALGTVISNDVERFLVDSAPRFENYEESMAVVRFANNLIVKLRGLNRKCFFVVPKDDADNSLLADLSMFADESIEL